MARRRADDDDDGDRPPPGYIEPPAAWECDNIAKQLHKILEALEAPPIDKATRSTLQRYLYRRQKYGHHFSGDGFGSDGRGYVTILVRTIIESTGNQNALVEPVVAAVASCMRPAWVKKGGGWIEAFDTIPLMSILTTMRSLQIFSEKSIGNYLAIAVKNRLWAIFGPDVVPVAQPAKAKRIPKPPAKVTRIPVNAKRIELGLKLIVLRSKAPGTKGYSALRKKQFGDVEPKLAVQVVAVAKMYGARPEIYRAASWQALVELSSPSLSTAARQRFEAAIIAGKDIKARQIKSARGNRQNGRPGIGERPTARMAA